MKLKQLRSVTRGVGIVFVLLGLSGCRQEPASGVSPTNTDDELAPVVLSANYPLHEFASIIGEDRIETVFIVPGDVDPAFWRPDSSDIGRMQQADLVLLNGAGYEKWLPTVSLAEGRLVDTSEGFREHYIFVDKGVTHQHGPEGEHPHGGVAFTTWMDFNQAAEQARAVERSLAELSPANAEIFARNLSALTNKLSVLDQEFLKWGGQLNGSPLIASHPVYQYFARRYSLNLKSVHWEPDIVPNENALAELDSLLRAHPAKFMIWESSPNPESVKILNGRGLTSVVIDPAGNAPDTGGVLDAMESNLLRAKAILD